MEPRSTQAFLRNENISSSELWESVQDDIEYDGYIVFDGVVLSKPYTKEIEVLRSQWSGSDKKVVLGIGIVACLYVNPKTGEYWIIDNRPFISRVKHYFPKQSEPQHLHPVHQDIHRQ